MLIDDRSYWAISILALLARRPDADPMTLPELAGRLGVQPSVLHPTVQALRRAGLLKERRHPEEPAFHAGGKALAGLTVGEILEAVEGEGSETSPGVYRGDPFAGLRKALREVPLADLLMEAESGIPRSPGGEAGDAAGKALH